jgi:hypothetical protein
MRQSQSADSADKQTIRRGLCSTNREIVLSSDSPSGACGRRDGALRGLLELLGFTLKSDTDSDDSRFRNNTLAANGILR